MIKEIHSKLISKKISAVELVKEYLTRAKKLNKKYNSFISFTDELAIKTAKSVDDKIKKGEHIGYLAGIPISIKDNILVKAYKTTAGSKILKNYTASYDADVVSFLKQEQALIIGKTNMDEFAMGASGEYSAFGRTKNPINIDLVTGGSSSGSAASVASNQAIVSLGSDTGGSVREPASFCSVVGFKPSYGKVSRSGLIAMASSLDQIGIISNNVSDAAITLKVISKDTSYDSTKKIFTNITNAKTINQLKGLRIGIPKTFLKHGIEQVVLSSFNNSLQKLEKNGAEIINIDLSILEYVVACYYIIMSAEASSNLARYTHIRYGGNRKDFGNEVKKRILLGTYVLSSGYFDKYYNKAIAVKERILESLNKAFNSVDLIAMPTTPTRPFKPGERSKNPIAMYLEDIFTASANLSEMPAISLPLSKNGIGIQLMARKWEDEKLLINAMNVERLFKTKD